MTNDDTAKFAVSAKHEKRKNQVVYADADTLSSFLNRNNFGYFMNVFEALEAEVIISKTVLNELYYNGKRVEIRKGPIEQMIRTKRIFVEDIDPVSEVADTYYELCESMGKGEASALALAKHSEKRAVVASNNMRDIADYARKNNIELWPTARIMQEAIELKVMSMEQADKLWKKMKEDGLKLPSYETFEEYYRKNIVD